jgi:hypothetical protein
MKTGRFLFVVSSSLLLVRAISLADDQRRASADVGLRQGKWVNDRSLHIPQPIRRAILKPSPTTSRNHGLAIIGGPANTSRSTAVINGTNMKRKP